MHKKQVERCVCFKYCSLICVCVCVFTGDPSGAYVVVVDDLIQTGGTMMECVKVGIRVVHTHIRTHHPYHKCMYTHT